MMFNGGDARGDRKQPAFDDAHIQKLLGVYPEGMAETLPWLARYARENCRGDLRVLESKARDLGYTTSYSYLRRVFSGRYFQEKDGKVQGSVDGFNEVVDALQRDAQRCSRLAAVDFVPTGTWIEIKEYIDLKRIPQSVCRFGVITGPTGAQKSTCYRRYRDEIGPGHVKYLEAPGPFLGQMLLAIGRELGLKQYTSVSQRETGVFGAITSETTLIVDNAQELHRPRAGRNQQCFSFLRRLQDITGCCIILSVTEDFTEVMTQGDSANFYEQFEGRAGGREQFKELPSYTPRADIAAIARAFGMKAKAQDVDYLAELCRKKGKVRILFDSLQRAKRVALTQKEELTIEHIKYVRNEV